MVQDRPDLEEDYTYVFLSVYIVQVILCEELLLG